MSAALRERDVSRDLTPEADHIAPGAPDRAWPKMPTATSTRVRSVDRDLMMEFLADRAPALEVAADWRQQLEDELSRAAVEAGLDPEY
jgi:hypothetical protein